MRIAVVGVTGLVGSKLLELLTERNFPVEELIPVASKISVGKTLDFLGKSHAIVSMQDAVEKRPDIAIFSAGGGPSLEWAPRFAEAGCFVIDNSSAWRMDKDKPLIVPEINGDILTEKDKIIANPNCSTIQLVMALMPLHNKYLVKRVVVSTYQSITGTGIKAVRQMEGERAGSKVDKIYPHRIDQNCLPHCDVFLENAYTKEEMKLAHETCKILGDYGIRLTATAVRVPVLGGHSESVNVEFLKEFELGKIKELLTGFPGVTVIDDPAKNLYPMPLSAQGKDEVFVGRIRRDETQEKTLNMWIVSDNLRKGAATNAVQIAEYLKDRGFVGQ